MKAIKKTLPLLLVAAMLISGCGKTESVVSASISENVSSKTETSVSTSVVSKTEAVASVEEENKEAAKVEEKEEPTVKREYANEALEFAANLKLGWNLGNTLDATGSGGLYSETSWGQPKATAELMQFVKDSGFTSVRIPVSWAMHMDSPDTINPEWMARVTEVVDYALDADLYVIINSHHDDYSYYPSEENIDAAKAYLKTVWTQICENFKDYDERFIFEAMNEPRLADTDIEWWFDANDERGCKAIEQICILDQLFVDTVRESGGNNATRYIMISSYAASIDFTIHKSFTLPTDPAEHMMVSIHAYTPYDFTMNKNGYDEWTGSKNNELNFIYKLNANFNTKGIPVVIGEFGATNKNNLESRVAWAKEYTKRAAENGIPCFVWDNGGTSVGEENFGLIDRKNLKIYYPELLDAYLSGYTY